MKVNYWIYFFLAARYFGVMFIFPLFNDSIVPKMIKVVLAGAFAAVIYPYFMNNAVSNDLIYDSIILAKEFAVGVLLGYLAAFPIWLIENVGNLIDTQRGEQFGALVNQLTKNPSSSLSKLLNQAFVSYFAALGGIYMLINLVMQSFLFWPPVKFILEFKQVDFIIKSYVNYFFWLIMLALPVLLAMFVLEVVLGIMSSFVQQLNVTVISMPIKSLLATIILILLINSMFNFIVSKFLGTHLFYVFKV